MIIIFKIIYKYFGLGVFLKLSSYFIYNMIRDYYIKKERKFD